MEEVRLWRHLQMKGGNILSRLRQCLQTTLPMTSVTPSFAQTPGPASGVMKYMMAEKHCENGHQNCQCSE